MSDVAYTWSYVDETGRAVETGTPSPRFPSQGEAEAWFAEEWEQVRAAGVDAVVLRHGDEVVYGPMSLQAMGE
ncbi:hypothetical protein [Arsenicicoccus sp. oral taxon 190]|uniref:hypothetical protein n=1 Tax=Arsenicicoccus sp. oral taxon 190 TaxID=1658671 RepID=UPI00067A0863|nr:hypothetical protein [Arsenicicoccus sp. oral taxon 190]AKT52072.1 hypothetical protein ADJ73_13705 [Arsenicicoccus sp. oral taxon 190]